MNQQEPPKEPKKPETLEEALMMIAYHSGVFFFKIALIVFLWVWIAETLRKWMMP